MTSESARSTLNAFLAIGLIMAVIGGIIMGAAWPGTETEYGGLYGSDTLKDTGSVTGVWIGALIASAGSSAILVWIIGMGVKLGVQASGRFTQPASAAAPPRSDGTPTQGGHVGSAPVTRQKRSLADITPLDPMA